jgi:multidrug efflux pump subunit AcrB
LAHGETGASSSSCRSLKIIALTALFVVYLVLALMFSGEIASIFARQQMHTAAYLALALLYTFGTTIFILGLRKLLRAK